MTPAESKKVLKRSQRDPAWWARTVLGVRLWAKQVSILESVRDNAETSVRSCHSMGKSFVAAVIALWFLFSHPRSIVITTAPTDRQVRGILWKEIGAHHRRAKFPLGGRPLAQELKVDRDWYAWGFTTSDYDPERFQGFHAEHILVLVDEASGISNEIMDAIDSVLAGGHPRKLEIGNPMSPLSAFAESFKRQAPRKFKVSAFDTPNFTEPGITLDDIREDTWRDKVTGELPYPTLVTPEWVHRMWVKHGENSPFWKSRVLAEFPQSGKDALIPWDLMEAALERGRGAAFDARTFLSALESDEPTEVELDLPSYISAHLDDVPTATPVAKDPELPVNTLGCDIGRGGDPSVLAQRFGFATRILDSFDVRDTMVVVGHIARALESTGATQANVDAVGIGAGVVDRGREQGLPYCEAQSGAKSDDPAHYANTRSQWLWHLRELAERGDLAIYPDEFGEVAAAQLSSIKWKPDSGGRVVVERKEDTKKRLGRSPDEADAIMFAFAPVGQDDWELV